MRPHAVFRSFLGPDIDQFLAHERSLGRRYDVEKKTLALFDAYLVNSRIGGLHELNSDACGPIPALAPTAAPEEL